MKITSNGTARVFRCSPNWRNTTPSVFTALACPSVLPTRSNPHHLQQLSTLVAAIRPARISEHLSWGSIGGRYFNDLLPVPYTRASLRNMSDKIQQVQQSLGCRMLIENPSSYLQLAGR